MGGSVLKSYIKTLAIVAGLGWAGAACAVGFGSANVNSALGQPLKIEIALTSVSDSDRNGMTAHLASPDAFKAAGLEYPYHLSKLKFDIAARGRQTYIFVTSKEPVNDSFINILVELSWPSGRLLREYTFLLDPPDYKPEQSKPEPVAPIEPAIVPTPAVEVPVAEPIQAASAPEAASAPVEAVPAGIEPIAVVAASQPEATPTGLQTVDANAASGVQAAPVEAQTAPLTQPETAPTQTAATTTQPKRETIAVKRGDNLSKIAAQVREPDMTLEQMLVALYRANVKQFDGKNMNRIRAGKILTIPEPGEYEHLSQKEATKEIRIQTANWRAYRQKLAAAVTTAPAQTPTQAAGGKISTTVADQAPQPKEPANGKLVLSKGETPGDKTGAAGSKQAKENAAKEEAIAKAKQAEDDKIRIAALEKSNQDKQRAIELKGGVPQPASPVAPATASQVGATPQAASGVRKAPTNVAPPAEEKSFLDDIMDTISAQDPMYLGGGAGALLLLVGGGFYLMRRRNGEGGGSRKKKR